jgi:hypothetical protein
MADRPRTVLTHIEVALLAKVAAVVHDNGLLDPDATSPLIVDLCRKCSESTERGEVLAVSMSEANLLTAIANSRKGSD